MPLQTIPVLAQDYPVFDWSQYQSSRDALVKDHPVADFTKETWNAIVDTLSDALADAGLEWDAKYTTADGAKVTKAYGALTATMFNSVRHNIDHPASIGWGWANNTAFRGYVGRENFRGHGQYGAACDLFYPEYIIELVRKLNLLIEIMRDTANISDAEHQSNSATLMLPNLLAKPSAPMTHEDTAESTALGGLMAKPSAPIDVDVISRAKIGADLLKVLCARLEIALLSQTKTDATMQKPRSAAVWSKSKSATLNDAEIAAKLLKACSASYLSSTKRLADMDVWKSLHISGNGMAESSGAGQFVDMPPFPVIGSAVSESTQDVDVTAAESAPIRVTDLCNTVHKGEILPREPFGVAVADKSTTQHSATPEGLVVGAGVASVKSESGASAQIDSAWYPPIWVDGVLWIRQTFQNKQMDDILHIDETPDLAVVECSESIIFAQLDTAWQPPVWVGDALMIVQAYETTQTDNELGVV